MERGGWGLNGLSLKALLHEAIFPATSNATGDDSMAWQGKLQNTCYMLQLTLQHCKK